jgi:ribose-phosphate pyrophosphokinase
MIKLLVNSKEVQYKRWNFPSGELGVKLENLPEEITFIEVEWNFENNEEIFELLLLSDAFAQFGKMIDRLRIPYLPYSRQDRVCHSGESFSLEVIAKLINLVNAQQVSTWDVHSEVAYEKIFRLNNIQQYMIAAPLPKFDVLIAPDKGAAEKAKLHDQVICEGTPVVFLTKTRKDGKVLYDDLESDTIQGEACVVDDLCDGGGTFLSLAEMLRRTQPGITKLSLYVTHGLFTAGAETLLLLYDEIFTANLVNSKGLIEEGQVKVIR